MTSDLAEKMARCQAIAREHGGACLSQEYVNQNTLMKWKCGDCGRTWETTPKSVFAGHWCKPCGLRRPRRWDLSTIVAEAENRGGKCLSKAYINSNSPLEWECREKHRWEAPWSSIHSAGKWCPVCASRRRIGSKIGEFHDGPLPGIALKKVLAIVGKKGGKVLSKTYIGFGHHYLFGCKKGHTWKAVPTSIVSGSWCPICAGRLPPALALEELKAIAAKKNGVCLSSEYKTVFIKLNWRCEFGHEFSTIPLNVKRGSWCPTCAILRRTFRALQRLAKKRGGEVLSENYLGRFRKLDWKCNRGHVWQDRAERVRSGGWCLVCAASATRRAA